MKLGSLSRTQQKFPSQGVACIAVLLLFAGLSFLPAVGQSTVQVSGTGQGTPILLSGIVVEEVGKGYPGTPVLHQGDVLLSWSRGDAHGEFESPTFFWFLKVEEQALGPVIVHGIRGGQAGDWTLTQNDLWSEVSPNFGGAWLQEYKRAGNLAKADRVSEAGERWLAMARSVPDRHVWLPAWLSYHAGRVLADHRLWKQADKAYAEAVHEAGIDLNLLAPIHRAWGRSLWESGEWDKADEHYNNMVSDLRQAGWDLARAEFLTILGENANIRGKLAQAREYFRTALTIKEQFAPTSSVASTLFYLGDIAFQCGELDEAERKLSAALDLYRSVGSDGDKAATLVDLADVAFARTDLVAAEKYLREALKLETRSGNSGSGALVGFAWIAEYRGDFTQAAQLCRRQLDLERKRNPVSQAVVFDLTNLGTVYAEQGFLVRAERRLRQALRMARSLAPISEYTAAALGNLGELAARQGRWKEAESFLVQSMEIERKLESSVAWTNNVAERLERLGDIAERRGYFREAEDHYQRAAERLAKLEPGGAFYAESLAGLAGVYRLEGNLQGAREYYEQALNALESQTTRLGGSNELRASFRAKHEKIYREHVDLLLRLNQPEIAFAVLERSRARTLLETLAAGHTDIHKGADPELLDKERSLQATLKAKSERRSRLLSGQQDEEELKAVEKEISNLAAEYQDVEAQIRSSSPVYAALTQPQPLSLAEIQKQLLDPDTVLLEYSLGEERSHVFVVSSDSLHVEELPRRTTIEAASRRVYDLLTARNLRKRDESPAARMARLARAESDFPAAVARLSRMTLAPVAERVAGKRLLIVSDGALNYVPFAALPVATPGKPPAPLAAEHEIVSLPSASVLAVLRRERMGREPAAKTVAVLADPVFDAGDARVKTAGNGTRIAGRTARGAGDGAQEESESSLALAHLTRSVADFGWRSRRRGEVYLPRLGFSRREAEAIAAVTPPGQALEALDFRASRATALGADLANYRVVHLATHALLNSKHPELSGLVFSLVDEQGRPQNGFLDLEDIYNMNLPAELVVLSACETGLGKEISGEGMVGLTRGFMYAGASRVMASLWKIDDRATAELMRHFYQAMVAQGMRPAAALRAAQLQMQRDKRWGSPYFWAAFQIQGEWK
jgi:CHAT domain-containing protein/Tfp pilus assembly protein PilF